jgi:hypothetical protein
MQLALAEEYVGISIGQKQQLIIIFNLPFCSSGGRNQ